MVKKFVLVLVSALAVLSVVMPNVAKPSATSVLVADDGKGGIGTGG